MARTRTQSTLDHPVAILFVVIAVVAAMGLAAEVLKPLSLAVLLSFALSPIAGFLEKKGLPRVPSVIITVCGTLGILLGIGYVVAGQLDNLAHDLSDPAKRALITEKVQILKPKPESNLSRVQATLKDVAKTIDPDASKSKSGETEGSTRLAGEKTIDDKVVQDVHVVEQPMFRQRLQSAIGPFLEVLTIGSFVLVLVLFLMVDRDDLGDRVISLFGGRQVSTTTRTMREVGERVGRYLALNAMVNASMGVTVGIGVWLIGLPYATLWGLMTALLRFVPYVGTTIAISLPTVYALASFPGWGHALMVVGLFLVIEIALNSFLEPIIYGKTTGVSALGLLVAAMFWTWLWGVWGLLLSTPLTVTLAVLGKYVPALSFFSTILSEDSELGLDVRYYKKLLALDEDGAVETVEEAAKTLSRLEIFDQILLPALARAERDSSRDEVDEETYAFVLRITEQLIDENSFEPILPESLESAPDASSSEPLEILGLTSGDKPDLLALKMLIQILDTSTCRLTIRAAEETPLALAESLVGNEPQLILMSHVPPSGLTQTRYLLRRLHARFEELPILVGRWTEGNVSATAVERLTMSGATGVVTSLMDARAKILELAHPKTATAVPPLSPAMA